MAPGHPPTIGRYTVQRVLGRGGMGTVYLATDPLIEREVAIKVLPLAGADEYSDRLIAEARVSGRLIHPNIVGVFDIGEEDGQPFVVMPYVPGRTLASILTAPDRPAIATKLRWMTQLCDALAYAHGHRVIHRDIKPTNLLIDDQQNLRVLDFGIAKVLTTSQIQFTSVGTPAYMAPEQYSSDPVDPRTDVFSAGLVFYELITHRRALTGTTPAHIYGQLMAGPLPRVLDAAPDTDPALAAICERAMSRDPKDRFQTARALGDALEDVHQRWVAATLVAPTVPRDPQGPPAPAPDPAPTLATRINAASVAPPVAAPVAPAPMFLQPAPAPSRVLWVWSVLAVAAVVGTLGVLWASRGTTPPTPIEKPWPGPVPPRSVPSSGRIRVVSDLGGTTFWLRPAAGGEAKSLAANQTVPPGRYEIRADYLDKDPLPGDPRLMPTSVRQTIDVVAGLTTDVNMKVEPALWRGRFVRALQRPVARDRAAVLERTYRRLKELGALVAADTARYQQAVSEQQLVRFVKRDFAMDHGLERYVQYTRFDIVRVDDATQRIAILGGTPGSLELASGRHEFAAVLDVTYGINPSQSQSMLCYGSFDVPGGGSVLQLKMDAIIRRPPRGDGKVAAQCQVGGAAPFVPAPEVTAGPESATLTVRVLSQGRPVPGVTIILGHASNPLPPPQASDANGTATFSGLRSGDYRVSTRRDGYRAGGGPVSVDATTTLYTVHLDARLAQTTTDERGRFRINVNPGLFDVFVTGAGTAGAFFEGVSVTTSHGALLEATLRAPSHPGVGRSKSRDSDDGGVISGLFLDANGAPLAGVSINVYPARTNVAVPAR